MIFFYGNPRKSLNNKIEEHNSCKDTDEPIVLTNNIIQEILALSGVPDEITTKIEKSSQKILGIAPIADILIDNKALAAKAERKKEEMLENK